MANHGEAAQPIAARGWPRGVDSFCGTVPVTTLSQCKLKLCGTVFEPFAARVCSFGTFYRIKLSVWSGAGHFCMGQLQR